MILASSFALVATVLSAPEPDILTALAPVQGGLTRDAVIGFGLKNAPEVHAAYADDRKAEERSDSAYSAFAPRLDLRASYTRLPDIDQPMIPGGPGGEGFEFPNFLNQFRAGAYLSIPLSGYIYERLALYRGTKRYRGFTLGMLRARQEAAALRAIEFYYDLVGSRAAEEVARRSVQVRQARLDDLNRKLAAGLVIAAERDQTEAQLAQVRVTLEQSRAVVALATSKIQRILVVPKGTDLRHGEDLFSEPPGEVEAEAVIQAEALKTRPEIQAMQALIAASEEDAGAAFSRLFPEVVIDASVEAANPRPGIFPQTEEWGGTWLFGVQVSWSPNDFVTSRVLAVEADREIDKAISELYAARSRVGVEVTAAHANYHAARRSIVAAREGLAAARSAFESRTALFDAGSSTVTDVLNAEDVYRTAELSVVNAYLGAHRAYARLEHARGRLTAGLGEPDAND